MKIILITESQLPSMSKYHTEILKIMRIMQRYNKILAKYVNNKVVPYNNGILDCSICLVSVGCKGLSVDWNIVIAQLPADCSIHSKISDIFILKE